MGWEIGFDENWNRFVGYGVTAYCDFPKCNATINRGLAYVCGNEPYGGDNGCGLFFCPDHLNYLRKGDQVCSRCGHYKDPFNPKPEHPDWIKHVLKDPTWKEWRKKNKKEVEKFIGLLLLHAASNSFNSEVK